MERPTPAGQRQLRRLSRQRGSRHISTVGDEIGRGPDPAPGGYLRSLGFDVRPGRTAHAEGRLIQWWQLYLDDGGPPPPVGQLVVAWLDGSETVARLEYLESDTSVARGGVEELVLGGVHAAADAGSEVIEHRLDIEHLQLGLPWQPENGARCRQRLDHYTGHTSQRPGQGVVERRISRHRVARADDALKGGRARPAQATRLVATAFAERCAGDHLGHRQGAFALHRTAARVRTDRNGDDVRA